MLKAASDRYPDLRDAVRALCSQFPDEYHRKVDEQRAYPESFVDALTRAGPEPASVTLRSKAATFFAAALRSRAPPTVRRTR